MKILFLYLMYFLILLIACRVLHMLVLRFNLGPNEQYIHVFCLGLVAWVSMRLLAGSTYTKWMGQHWYITFTVAMLAILTYNVIADRFFDE